MNTRMFQVRRVMTGRHRSIARGPRSNASRHVFDLQRAVGNKTVSTLLRSGRVPSAPATARRIDQKTFGVAAVQRWDDNAAVPGSTVDWNAAGIDFSAPAGGASGGVMKVTHGNQVLFVKPEASGGTHPSQVTAADKFFSGGRFGVDSPMSRIVTGADGAEFAQLKAKMNLTGHDASNVQFFKIMNAAGDSDVMKEIKGGHNDPDVAMANAIGFVGRNDIWRQMGRVAVGDTFIYNNDRFSEFKANFGNLMIGADGAYMSIDAEASFGKIAQNDMQQAIHRQGRFGVVIADLATLFAEPRKIFDNILLGVKEVVQSAVEDPAARADLGKRFSEQIAGMRPDVPFLEGIAQGKEDLRNALMDKAFINSVKAELARSFKNEHGVELAGGRQNLHLFKAVRLFVQALFAGKSRAAADGVVDTYLTRKMPRQRRTLRQLFRRH